ncbi:MAG: DNA recombination protein RmuC [Gammaproteobacteria bacterium]|nr:MAG: DNA recombination protein RmuC [Gammaproteobacteria bacterium]
MDIQSAVYGFLAGSILFLVIGFVIHRLVKKDVAIKLGQQAAELESAQSSWADARLELAVAKEKVENCKVLEKELEQLRPMYQENISELATSKQQIMELGKKELQYLEQIKEQKNIATDKEKAVNGLQVELADLRVLNQEFATRIEEERKQSKQNIKLLEDAQGKLSEQFQNLANKIFEEKGKKFTEQNKEHIGVLLNPLREQLGDFKKKVEDAYDKETKDRISLKEEIKNLRDLNQQINQEAKNLTNALTKDNKAMGDWGEMQLERILEDVGLVKGREYEEQAVYKNEEGANLRPDFVVHLPEGKDVVIDSKVTLDSWVGYCSADDKEEKDAALKGLIASVKNHVRGLKDKDYRDLKGMRSLDFVLMFIPVEGAMMLALESEPQLFKDAFDSGVLIVGPTNLMGTLRTIERIWRFEKQNKNAQKMAEEAGKIYDQFALVVESLDDIEDKLDKARNAFDLTKKRMVEGRGNLVNRINSLKKLGATTKKELSEELVGKAELEDSKE